MQLKCAEVLVWTPWSQVTSGSYSAEFDFDNRMVCICSVIAARGLAASSINPRTLQEKHIKTTIRTAWKSWRAQEHPDEKVEIGDRILELNSMKHLGTQWQR